MPEEAIFRRFASLNIQNLLYYQAELTVLEKQLRDFELGACQFQTSAPDKLPAPVCQYATDWEWLGLRQPQNPQWQCMLKIRDLLEKYSSFFPVPHSRETPNKRLTPFFLDRCRNYSAKTDVSDPRP